MLKHYLDVDNKVTDILDIKVLHFTYDECKDDWILVSYTSILLVRTLVVFALHSLLIHYHCLLLMWKMYARGLLHTLLAIRPLSWWGICFTDLVSSMMLGLCCIVEFVRLQRVGSRMEAFTHFYLYPLHLGHLSMDFILGLS